MNNHYMLALFLSLLLVLTIPTATATNIPLTQKEVKKYGADEFGLLSNGHFYKVFEYNRSPNDEYKQFKGTITMYNTYNKVLNIEIDKTFFSEEREHDTIKKDYIYYNLPNLDWITIPDEITIQPNHKYTFEYSINLPVKKAFQMNKDGGYIFLIIPTVESEKDVQVTPAYKVFITLIDPLGTIKEEDDIPSLIGIFLLIFSGLLLFIIYFYKRKETTKEIPNEKD